MKVLLLSANTGEGHTSAAHAVGEELERNGVEVIYREHTNLENIQKNKKQISGFSKFVNNVFLKNKFIFGFCYGMAVFVDLMHFSPIYISNKKYAKKLNDFINENHIDAVVSTHMYPTDTMYYIRKKYNPNIPVYHILTDYRPHPFFTEKIYGDGKFKFFIHGTKKNINFLRKRGYPDDIVFKTGIPVHSYFNESISKEEVRKKLGWPVDKKILFVVGDRDNKIFHLCKEINENLKEDEICVFDSLNNKDIEEKLKTVVDKDKFIIISYSDHFNLCLKASDVIITKAGGSTTTESAVVGLPIVHTSCMPWLESQNAKYFSENGMSIYENNKHKVVVDAFDLLRNKNKQEEMIKKQNELINKNADIDIAKIIIEDLKSI